MPVRGLGAQVVVDHGPAAAFAVLLLLLAFRNGGYFPATWGQASIVLWLACLATLLLATPAISRGQLWFVVSLLALLVWTAASALWSESAPRSISEAERTALLLAAVTASVLLFSRNRVISLLVLLYVALSTISLYTLWESLVAGSRTNTDVGADRLSGPLGYWNALALAAGMAVLLGAGLSCSRNWKVASGSAAIIPMLVSTLYLSFGRAAWLALVSGAVAMVAVASERARVVATMACIAPGAAAAIWVSSHHVGSARWPSGVVSIAMGAAAVAAGAFVRLADRLVPRLALVGRGLHRRVVLVVLAAMIGLAALLVHPVSLLQEAQDSFGSSIQTSDGDLNKRLISLSGNGRAEYWSVAWRDFSHHNLLGSGAGTFEIAWNADRPNAFGARDAHNLYLETLAELGPVGLAVLLTILLCPLSGLRRGRVSALSAGAAGAYTAFLFHAASDWDWEVPVLAIAALACGGSLLTTCGGSLLARWEAARCAIDGRVRAGTVICSAALLLFAVVTAAGNTASAASGRKAARGDYRAAIGEARRAIRWAPWAAEPWRLLAAGQLGESRPDAARESLRVAVRKDPNDWLNWAQLLPLVRGAERLNALTRLEHLNPRAVGLTPAQDIAS